MRSGEAAVGSQLQSGSSSLCAPLLPETLEATFVDHLVEVHASGKQLPGQLSHPVSLDLDVDPKLAWALRNRDVMVVLLIFFAAMAATYVYLIRDYGFPSREYVNVALLVVNATLLAWLYPWRQAAAWGR